MKRNNNKQSNLQAKSNNNVTNRSNNNVSNKNQNNITNSSNRSNNNISNNLGFENESRSFELDDDDSHSFELR